MLNEMLDFGKGITGLALNLEQTEVGVIILGDYTQLEEGAEVRATGKLLQVPVGKGLLGRVVNTLGEPLDGKGPIASDTSYPVEKQAPGVIKRKSIGHEAAFFWYVTAFCALALAVAIAMPDTREEGHLPA